MKGQNINDIQAPALALNYVAYTSLAYNRSRTKRITLSFFTYSVSHVKSGLLSKTWLNRDKEINYLSKS